MTVFAKRSFQEWVTAAFLVFVEVIAVFVAITLLLAAGPLFQFSWLSLLASGEKGTNLMVAPAQIPWFGLVFFGLLALNIPRLARREEEWFRRGTKNWSDAAVRSLKFGLMHMIVGVPLAAGLALWIAGMFFSWRYFVGGVRESTFYHSLHNGVILGFLGWVLFGSL